MTEPRTERDPVLAYLDAERAYEVAVDARNAAYGIGPSPDAMGARSSVDGPAAEAAMRDAQERYFAAHSALTPEQRDLADLYRDPGPSVERGVWDEPGQGVPETRGTVTEAVERSGQAPGTPDLAANQAVALARAGQARPAGEVPVVPSDGVPRGSAPGMTAGPSPAPERERGRSR